MARIPLLVLLVTAVVTSSSAASSTAEQPAEEEMTLDKATRAKKDAGYPYGGYGSYNTGYSNRGYGAYPTATAPASTGFYNADWSRSYPGLTNQYNQYSQYDPRYASYQPGYYQQDSRYNNYNRGGYNAYPGYNGYDARTATGYGGYSSGYSSSRYPYEDRFYSNYPYNNNYNRYQNDYNRRTVYGDNRYDNRFLPATGAAGYNAAGYNAAGYNAAGYNAGGYNAGGYNAGGYNAAGYNGASNTGYNYNSGYGTSPTYPVTQEYYYTPSASNQVYNTGYSGRYLKKRDGKDSATSATAPVLGLGPTPATPVA